MVDSTETVRGTLVRRVAVSADSIAGPKSWPIAYEDDDEQPDDHDPYCEGCVWCDQDHWRYAYVNIYKAHDNLVGSLRAMAEQLLGSNDAPQRSIGKALRGLVRDAEIARQLGVRPRPDAG